MKKDIIVNFPKQENFGILRSKQRPRELTKKFIKSAKLAKPTAKSTDTKKGSAGANQDCVHLNSKFGPMSIKFERWIGT